MTFPIMPNERKRFTEALQTAIAIPFIDDIEDYILEAIWAYTKQIDLPDPFFNIRSKKLYDVWNDKTRIGWSVKSLQWDWWLGCEFELVIQRADVFKKHEELGFPPLSKDSDPRIIGSALLEHWRRKVEEDAISQGVDDKRIVVLLKSNHRKFALLEEPLVQYKEEELCWKWTNSQKQGLKGIRRLDNMVVYRWYPSQKQFFERFKLPTDVYNFTLEPIRLQISQVAEGLSQHLRPPS